MGVASLMNIPAELPHFRGFISGQSLSSSRSSARVTVFCSSLLNAVTALHDYDMYSKVTKRMVLSLILFCLLCKETKYVKLFIEHAILVIIANDGNE